MAPFEGQDLFVFHPAFGYFADEYGLTLVAVEIGGKEPSARELARLIDTARQHQVHTIFVQPQFSPKSAQAIAEQIDGVVVPIDPLPQDYLAQMRAMGERIRHALLQ